MQMPLKKCDPMRQGLLNTGALELTLAKKSAFLQTGIITGVQLSPRGNAFEQA